jgi:phosphoribosylformylglycinamidine (FGAM) synthase-like amidotransferase family enzyme
MRSKELSTEPQDRIVLIHRYVEGYQNISEVLKDPNGHSDRVPGFLCGDGRVFQKDNHLCSTPPIRP